MEKFDEIVTILSMIYNVDRNNETRIKIYPQESEEYVEAEADNDIITFYRDGEEISVVSLTEDPGYCAMHIESMLIDMFNLCHKPIALPLYLYFRLFGMLWGFKASKELKDADPLPATITYAELTGKNENGETYIYHYMLNKSGQIIIEKMTINQDHRAVFIFTAEDYIEDPEDTVIRFFDFFKDIRQIESVGKG